MSASSHSTDNSSCPSDYITTSPNPVFQTILKEIHSSIYSYVEEHLDAPYLMVKKPEIELSISYTLNRSSLLANALRDLLDTEGWKLITKGSILKLTRK